MMATMGRLSRPRCPAGAAAVTVGATHYAAVDLLLEPHETVPVAHEVADGRLLVADVIELEDE
jgi:hypothetical protein